MRRARQDDVVEPEGDGGQRRACRDHSARKRDGILPQKIDGLRPLPDAFSQIHLKPLLLIYFYAPLLDTLVTCRRIIRRAGQSFKEGLIMRSMASWLLWDVGPQRLKLRIWQGVARLKPCPSQGDPKTNSIRDSLI